MIQDSVTFGATTSRHVSVRGVRVEFVHVAPVGGAVDPATSLLIVGIVTVEFDPIKMLLLFSSIHCINLELLSKS